MLDTRYAPQVVEKSVHKFWQDNNLFDVKPDQNRKPFSIVIPPPNVTGILHMGHALNNTFQDILVRFHRMKGYNSLWVPGIDHAGIATQNVVERLIKNEGGLRRQDLGREKFLERVWQWKEQYGSTIIEQLKRLGASCSWERTRFTMDEDYSEAVKEVFISLYEKGLIYRGEYIINWCPRCLTSLSDEEAPFQPHKGKLYYIKYPLAEGEGFIMVATTRPETMLGDVAVCVNPQDKRYKKLVNKHCVLPLVDRKIPILADSTVDKEFGTGAVKITPAHDFNDFEIARKKNLEIINIMDEEANITGIKAYEGLSRYEAREQIIKDLKKQKLLEKVEDYEHSMPVCYRCSTETEPRISKQWFVKMKPLGKEAIKVVENGKISFIPQRWTKVYLEWMYNIRDWCISRQIWWGHRLPVWYCKTCQENNKEGIVVSKETPQQCPQCKSRDLVQDEDVLDTWFSSWLWPFAVFGWPTFKTPYSKDDLEYFYPTSVLVTAPEIIFFWVARMIMSGLEFQKDIPFSDVYIHGTVRDIGGKKMSKSLGNIIDPLEIIDEMGADALRFSIISITSMGQDVFLARSKFEMGRNFTNKIWNLARLFMIMYDNHKGLLDKPLDPYNIDCDKLNISDKWMLNKLEKCKKDVNNNLENYKFNEAASVIYHTFWHKLCDWYAEIFKIDLQNSYKPEDLRNKFNCFVRIFMELLQMLHPFMPFITEHIYQEIVLKVCENNNLSSAIAVSSWPQKEKADFSREEHEIEFIIDIITRLRNIKHQLQIPLKKKLTFYADKKLESGTDFQSRLYVTKLAYLENIVYKKAEKPFATLVTEGQKFHLSLKGGDVEKEKKRVQKKLEELRSFKTTLTHLLRNEQFLEKAPEEEIEKRKSRLDKIEQEMQSLSEVYEAIK